METARPVVIADSPQFQPPLYRARVNKALKWLAGFAALAGCDIPYPDREQQEAWEAKQAAGNAASAPEPPPTPEVPPAPLEPDPAGTRWETAASGEGASLVLVTPAGERRLVFFCRPRTGAVLVNLPRFHLLRDDPPLRLTSGSRIVEMSIVISDPRRGGMSAAGPLTPEIAAMLTGLEPISVSYGGWNSGPHEAIMPEIGRGFVAACLPARG